MGSGPSTLAARIHRPPLVESFSPTFAFAHTAEVMIEDRIPPQQTVPRPAFCLLRRFLVPAQTAHVLRARKWLPADKKVVFCEAVNEETMAELSAVTVRLDIPFVFCPHFSGLEPKTTITINAGDVIGGSYEVHSLIGAGSFSRVYRANSLSHNRRPVSLKVVHNAKDSLDMGLVEIRMLTMISANDSQDAHHLLRVLDFFYVREHLVIVTELLNCSLYDHYMHLESLGERQCYYNASTFAALSAQMLDAIAFLHTLGITHCDVKPTNICIVSSLDRRFKLIDLGAAVLTYDMRSSYVQSRWYRAPEVLLGCSWQENIDEWAFGATLAELVVGAPIFAFDAVALVLAAQIAMRGALPSWMLQSGRLANTLVTDSGCAYEVDPKNTPAGVYLIRPEQGTPSLHQLLHDKIHPSLFGPNVEGFVSMVEALLEMDPYRRVRAASALTSDFVTHSHA